LKCGFSSLIIVAQIQGGGFSEEEPRGNGLNSENLVAQGW
jgi:hypothetical protein